MLNALWGLGYKAGDERYMPMFRDYLGMVAGGSKITYAVATLAKDIAYRSALSIMSLNGSQQTATTVQLNKQRK